MTIAEIEELERLQKEYLGLGDDPFPDAIVLYADDLLKLAKWALEKEAQIDRFCRCHLSANDENIMCESCDILADFPGGANE